MLDLCLGHRYDKRSEEYDQTEFRDLHRCSFLKMKSKLLRDAKTNVPSKRHELETGGMHGIPIYPDPDVQSGTYPHEACKARRQHISASAALIYSRDPILTHVQPGEVRTDEQFVTHVFGLIGTVRQPEPRLDVTAQARGLSALGA